MSERTVRVNGICLTESQVREACAKLEPAQPPDFYHTDDDLAMALELAYLVEREYVRVRFKGLGGQIHSWNNPQSDWLRAEVVRELRERGVR